MKKVLLTVLVATASVCTAFAQDHKATTTANATAAKETDQKSAITKQAQEWRELLVTELKLTDEQLKKIDEMDKAFGDRRQAIENNANLTDEQKKEKKMSLKKAWQTQFTNLLTPEQQVRYKELLETKNK